jgi:hypothetical protein
MIGYIVSILVHGDYISEFPRVVSAFSLLVLLILCI